MNKYTNGVSLLYIDMAVYVKITVCLQIQRVWEADNCQYTPRETLDSDI